MVGFGLICTHCISMVADDCASHQIQKTTKPIIAMASVVGGIVTGTFYVHSSTFGYAYLMWLGIAFYFNVFIGLLNIQILKNLNRLLFSVWFVTHLLISILILVFSVFHIWMVFYYE